MVAKKYQVFVSSTFRDLVEERQDAIRNILDLKHIPAGMELFPAADVDQLEYIKKVIDECDYYVLIMGGRYGSLDTEGVSYTEREYDYAVETGKVVLAFVHDDPQSIPLSKSDVRPEMVAQLGAFRDKVKSGRLVRGWITRQNLEGTVLKSLIHAFNDFPQLGWIRGDTAASEELLSQSNAALQENAQLKAEISRLRSELPAKIEDIAEFDDEFEVHFKYTVRSMSDESGHRKVSWRTIFLYVASQLDTPKTDDVIVYAFREALRDRGFAYYVTSVRHTDKTRIKVQLLALGLIRAELSPTTQRGVAEFLSLTAAGRATFIDGMVVRKATS